MGFNFTSEDAIYSMIWSFHPQHVPNLKQKNDFYSVLKISQQSQNANNY